MLVVTPYQPILPMNATSRESVQNLISQGRVTLPALDQTDVGSVDFSKFGELLLGDSLLRPDISHYRAKSLGNRGFCF
jgi:hypothetical protein